MVFAAFDRGVVRTGWRDGRVVERDERGGALGVAGGEGVADAGEGRLAQLSVHLRRSVVEGRKKEGHIKPRRKAERDKGMLKALCMQLLLWRGLLQVRTRGRSQRGPSVSSTGKEGSDAWPGGCWAARSGATPPGAYRAPLMRCVAGREAKAHRALDRTI